MTTLTKLSVSFKLHNRIKERTKRDELRKFYRLADKSCSVFRSCSKWMNTVCDSAYSNTYEWAITCISNSGNHLIKKYPDLTNEIFNACYEYNGRLKEISFTNKYPIDFTRVNVYGIITM